MDVARPNRPFIGILLRHAGSLTAYAHLVPLANRRFELEIAVAPEHRRGDATFLLRRALAEVARRGGGQLRYWLAPVTPEGHRRVRQFGLVAERQLLQLRRSLPLPEGLHQAGRHLDVRAFRPGIDEEAWLAVNNRAFAGHPDQGAWDVETLRRREAEPWFDPRGFLLHEEDGELAGFCWTKVHASTRPPMGEIYVVATDPAHHHAGVGRGLVVAGLEHLAARGLSLAMLYVDATNAPALRLYRSLGFTRHHVDRAYTTEVTPAD